MSPKERVWLATLPKVYFNATEAARQAGYRWPDKAGAKLKAKFSEEIEGMVKEQIMDAEEAAQRMAAAARLDLTPYLEGTGRQTWLNVEKLKADGLGWVIKGIKYNSKGAPIYETWDGQRALEKIYDNVTPQQGDKDRPFTIKVIETND